MRLGPTPTATAPVVPDSGDPDSSEDEPKLNLSVTQILAGTTAAVIAALLGSRLGVAGTLTGAALASVVSAVGSAIFGHSLLVTRRRLKAATAHVRSTGVGPVPYGSARFPASADADTVVLPVVTRADLAAAAASSSRQDARVARPLATSGHPQSGPIDLAGARLLARLTRQWRKALLVTVAASIAVFAGAVLTVTVAEAVKGSPLSGGADGGLSVLGGGSGEPAGGPETGPAPSSSDPSTTGSDTQDTPTTAADPTAGSGEVTTQPSDPTTEAPSEEAPPTQPTEPSPTPTAPAGAAEQPAGPTEAPSASTDPTTASDSPPAE